jgi:hypothetical protein
MGRSCTKNVRYAIDFLYNIDNSPFSIYQEGHEKFVDEKILGKADIF